MQVVVSPNRVDPGESFTVTPSGGTEPYLFGLAPSPPNPSGVTMVVADGVATVTVPADAPSGSIVRVHVVDSANPPAQATASARVN